MKRKTKFLVILIIGLFFIFSPSPFQIIANEKSVVNETQITDEEVSQGNVAIYNNKIVWVDYRNDNESGDYSDIYMYDLVAQTETRITGEGSYVYSTAIYNNKIVWVDYRNDNESGDYSDIYMYDLVAQTETRITPEGSYVESPVIYGDKIVWVDYRNDDGSWNYSDIYMYDLVAQTETRITPEGNYVFSPAIYGDKIVWADNRNKGVDGDYSDIYMYDLVAQEETRITPEQIYADSPAIYGDKIVWTDNRNDDGSGNYSDIYMYDISDQAETRITPNGSYAYSPAIQNNRIVWVDNRNNNSDGNTDVYMYDLVAQEEMQITTNIASLSDPAIYGDDIVWTDDRNGNSDVYLGQISLVEYTPLNESIIDNEFQGGGVAQGWNDDDASWSYELPFTFNFYGVNYSTIYVGSNGIICFNPGSNCNSVPGSIDENFGPFIAPMATDLMTNTLESNDIYITENADNVVIRWDAVEFNQSDQINFEAVLYENGNIKFNYGDHVNAPLVSHSAIIGISDGNGADYVASEYNETDSFDQINTSFWSNSLSLLSLSPSDNSTNIAINNNLSMTFDRAVYQGSGSLIIRKISDDSIFETIDASSSKITGWESDTITINPANSFSSNTGYYVLIQETAIKDVDNNYYSGISSSATWNFTTIDLSPQKQTVAPSDNSTDITVDTNLSIMFDKNIYQGAGNVYIKKQSDNSVFVTFSAGSSSLSGWGTPTLTINPSANLSGYTDYYVIIENGVVNNQTGDSYAGISSAVIWNFSTGSDGVNYQFAEEFTDDSYKDDGVTTALWDTDNGLVTMDDSASWTYADGVTEGKELVSDNFSSTASHKIVLDENNRPMIVWSGVDNNESKCQVRFSRWNGSAWTKADEITSGYDVLSSISACGSNILEEIEIKLDSLGNPNVVWLKSNTHSIYYTRWNGSTWTNANNTMLGAEIISGASLAYKPYLRISNNRPIIVWSGDSYINITRWNGSAWTKTNESTLGYEQIVLGGSPRFELDNNSRPVIIYLTSDTDRVYLTRWNGSAWTKADSATSGSDQLSSMLVNYTNLYLLTSGSNIYVAWKTDTNTSAFTYWNGSAWLNADGATAGDEEITDIDEPEIVLDYEGRPVIYGSKDKYVWSSDPKVSITRWNGSAWTMADRTTSGTEVIATSSMNTMQTIEMITSSSDDKIYALWSTYDAASVHFSYWNGSAWFNADGVTAGDENVSGNESIQESDLALSSDESSVYASWLNKYDSEVYLTKFNINPDPSKIVQSIKINESTSTIERATLVAVDATPGASRLEYFLSNNGGTTWEEVESGVEHVFTSVGNDLRWRAILYRGSMPTISSISVSFSVASGGSSGGSGGTSVSTGVISQSVIINNSSKKTNSRNVKLRFVTGNDIVKVSISENKNFINASILNFVSEIEWPLSDGDGLKTIYVRYYTQSGYYNKNEISSNIILETSQALPSSGNGDSISAKPDNDSSICFGRPYICEDKTGGLEKMLEEAIIIFNGDPIVISNQVRQKINKSKEETDNKKYAIGLTKDYNDSSAKQKVLLFIAYGTPSTIRLGEGERAGSVNSFISAFGKLPSTLNDWQDVIKIANGRWPSQRNLESEKNTTASFKKIYLHNPDKKNKSEDTAVVIIAYGLRPCVRNLNSEAKAIKIFRSIYGYDPKSASAWDIVRAIAYSGAKR